MLTILVRAAILFLILMATMRAMGKRQLGQFQPYELVITMLVANLVSTPMSDVGTPLLQGILPLGSLFLLHGAMTLMCMRSDRVRAFLCGKPTLVVSKGVWQEKEMENLCLTLSDVLEGMRTCGVLDPAEVCTAVMEANGVITAFPRSDCRPPTTSEVGASVEYEGIPMVLVMDGREQIHNLSAIGRDISWLNAALSKRGLVTKGVFLCSVDTQGRMFVQDREGGLYRYPVLKPEEVIW